MNYAQVSSAFHATQLRIWYALSLLCCLLIPVALSIFFFSNQSLRLDEAQSLWQTSRSFTDILTTVAGDVHVPFYHLVLRVWRLYIGDTVGFARALSLLFYVLSIAMLYVLGTLSYGRRTALFVAFLFSISPFMNWYGNEIRMYTLFTLFVIANHYFYMRLFKDTNPSSNTWAWYVMTALLGVFTHYFFFLNLAAQALFYFIRRDLFQVGSLRRFMIAALVIVLSFAPWVWFVLHLGIAGFQEPALTRPTSVDFFSALSQFVVGFQSDNVNTIVLSLWPIVAILGLFALRRAHRLSAASEYFLTTLLASFAIAFFGSFVVAPIFVSRYLIFTIPSMYLLIGSLLENYSPRLRIMSQLGMTAIMIAAMVFEIISPTVPVKEEYEDAVAYLNAHVTAQDRVLLSAPFTIYPVQYYYRGAAPLSTIPIWNQYSYGAIPAFDPVSLPSQISQATEGAQSAYLLLSYDQGYESSVKQYFDSHYQMLYQQRFSQDLNLYVYRLRYDTSLSQMPSSF